ncbi:MAG: hypothetical protein SVE93_00925 [Candidatus Thermoplasmatota archaeon]|nr:hypothetical protein [Candidatus Thermoplasmatota archaeon]
MRGGYFAGGIVLIAIAVMFALLPLFNGYNLIDVYNYYGSFSGKMERAIDEDARTAYSIYMTLIAIDIVTAIAGVALTIYGAAAKKE